MPRAQKLHPKPRAPPITIEKPDGGSGEENTRNFELEICWCIQQLERVLSEKKLPEKQLTESWKVLAVLKNNTQPIVRKRQLMRTHFGDYRGKMAAEEKKLVKMANSIKITDSPSNPKATFIRRSAFLSTGDESFKFDFDLSPEQMDSGRNEDDKNEIENGELHTAVLDGFKSKDEKENGDKIEQSNDKISETDIKTTENELKPFKFSFTDKPFRFNFATNGDL